MSSIARPAWRQPFRPRYQGATPVALKHKSWSGVAAYIKELKFSEPFCTDASHECSRLSIVMDLAGGQPDARSAISRPTPIASDTIHQMNFAPAKSPVWACSNNTRYFRVLSFTFDDGSIASLVDEDFKIDSAFEPRLMFFDARLFYLAKLFEYECESDEPTDMLYGDTLSLALLTRLVGMNRSQSRITGRGGLNPQQLRRSPNTLTQTFPETSRFGNWRA